MGDALLVLKHVTKQYESGSEAPPLAVLRGVSLQLKPKDAVAVVGPSGSGKSTLLNIMGTLDVPTTGSVIFEGRAVSELTEAERAELRSRRIGFVFQLHHLLPQLTVLENVLVPALAFGSKDRESLHARAVELLGRVGLSERMSYRPGQLSGGERQRVAVVRALVTKPRLLLADEPTGSLDRRHAEDLMELLCQLRAEEGLAVVVVTHARDLAGKLDRVLELREGVLVPQGEGQ